jgi:nitrite reductase/ring-hydroxylating ferredoxin subunit
MDQILTGDSIPAERDSNMTFLCNADDIQENTTKGYELLGFSLFIVREKKEFYIYKNLCPHAGTQLNWLPDVFLTNDKSLIQCATHGALFKKENGICIGGPCQGQHLSAIVFKIDHNKIFVSIPPNDR